MLRGAVQSVGRVLVPLLEGRGGQPVRVRSPQGRRGTLRIQAAVPSGIPLGPVEEKVPEERLTWPCFIVVKCYCVYVIIICADCPKMVVVRGKSHICVFAAL